MRRVFESSAIRRGRKAVSPVWYVRLTTGEVMRFNRKKDALVVQAADGCTDHRDLFCECGSSKISARHWEENKGDP